MTEMPTFKKGDKVVVDHDRYKGEGFVGATGNGSAKEWCDVRGWLIPVVLENGNTWYYEADTVRLSKE